MRLLDPSAPDYHPAVRKAALYPAWTLLLRWSKSIAERGGWHELDKPGRRIEAIGGGRAHTAANSGRRRRGRVQNRSCTASSRGGVRRCRARSACPPRLNHASTRRAARPRPDRRRRRRLGRDRGARTCGRRPRGQDRAPGTFRKLADAATAAGDAERARGAFEQVKRAGAGGEAGGPAGGPARTST